MRTLHYKVPHFIKRLWRCRTRATVVKLPTTLMTTAGQQRIRIPTFQSPTSQAKTPAATQSRAEERAARIKVQGNK